MGNQPRALLPQQQERVYALLPCRLDKLAQRYQSQYAQEIPLMGCNSANELFASMPGVGMRIVDGVYYVYKLENDSMALGDEGIKQETSQTATAAEEKDTKDVLSSLETDAARALGPEPSTEEKDTKQAMLLETASAPEDQPSVNANETKLALGVTTNDSQHAGLALPETPSTGPVSSEEEGEEEEDKVDTSGLEINNKFPSEECGPQDRNEVIEEYERDLTLAEDCIGQLVDEIDAADDAVLDTNPHVATSGVVDENESQRIKTRESPGEREFIATSTRETAVKVLFHQKPTTSKSVAQLPENPHRRTMNDREAAIYVLRQLFTGGRPLPDTKKALKSSVIKYEGDKNVQKWSRTFGKKGSKALSQTRDAMILRLCAHYETLDCVRVGPKKSLSWNKTRVRVVLAEESSDSDLIGMAPIPPIPAPVQASTAAASFQLIETRQSLDHIAIQYPFAPEISEGIDPVVAMDCQGVPDHLYLVQVHTGSQTFVFDCVKLGAAEVCQALRPLLESQVIVKLMHDVHGAALAFSQHGGIALLGGVFDTQLAMEVLTGEADTDFTGVLEYCDESDHPLKLSTRLRMKSGELFGRRPLSSDILEYAGLNVFLLSKVKEKLFDKVGNKREALQMASCLRAHGAVHNEARRQICFNVADGYSMASWELAQTQLLDGAAPDEPLIVSDDSHVLLDLIPEDLRDILIGHTREISDIVLDKGREPLAWVNGERVLLGDETRLVSMEDINRVVDSVGGFGGDNRAGLEKQLHRISAMRNRQQDIVGLTLRIGRHVSGNAAMILDIMFADTTQSILFLGEPGSGKTTVVREITRRLAERHNVCIVDTSNEIAGDGDVPHPCVGYARRMMVPSLDQQSKVMIECVQNHTPEVMVIDEIGRSTEVEAARTCKQRGVRLIASAHGDLRKLVKNPKLRGLIGGVETVTLGDLQAKIEAKKAGRFGELQKSISQRAGPPAFEVIVELRRGAHHEWNVITNVGEAVDNILKGQSYKMQRRTRNPDNGALFIEHDEA